MLTEDGWSGEYYVKDGKAVTGLLELNGKKYLFGDDGKQLVNGFEYKGEWYYAPEGEEHGALKENYFRDRGNGYTYYGADGIAARGWLEYDGTNSENTQSVGRYYQDENSWRIVTGYQFIESRYYYFEQNGILFVPTTEGWYTKGGQKRYFLTDGEMLPPPVITTVDVSTGSASGRMKVNVHANFSGAAAAEQAYSFDGGVTWQAANNKEFAVGTVISKGQIQVRDSIGYTVVYDSEVVLSGGTTGFGIDVSSYQGVVDWKAMANNGVKYAIIRAVTWKGQSIVEDPYFRTNVRNAKANGIYVGAYIYSYAFTQSEMAAEVQAFDNAAKALKAEGYTMDMPVYIDYEDARLLSDASGLDYNARTDLVRYGMVLLDQKGYYPGFYTYYNFAKNAMNGQQLMNEGYDFWLAHWDVASPGWDGIEMWQYGTTYINGMKLDANISYKDYAEIIHGSGGGSHVVTPETVRVYDDNSKQVVEASINTILAQMVANEVGSTVRSSASHGDALTAYKVQTVAAHSWLAYQYAHNVLEPHVKLATLDSTTMSWITEAVAAVQNDYLFYNGEVALTTYYSCSGGQSNSAMNYWGTDLPYLRSVNYGSLEKDLVKRTGLQDYQPMADPNKANMYIRSKSELRASILAVQPKANLSGPLSGWIEMGNRNAAGYWTTVKLGGVQTDIAQFYEGIVGPYSLNFTMEMTTKNGEEAIHFTSYGFGHGVGMSQYAMIEMASGASPMSVRAILEKCYPGATYVTINS